MNKVITIIGLIAILILFWQLVEVDYQRDKLSDKVQLQEKQVQALGALVTETQKERDENQKKFTGFLIELKKIVEENPSAFSSKQYSTFMTCDPRVGGGISCFSY
jgi:uncharacterized coiled-coil protein SlyX